MLNSIQIHVPTYEWDTDSCSDTPCPADIYVSTGPDPKPDCVKESNKCQMLSLITLRPMSNLIQSIKPEYTSEYSTKWDKKKNKVKGKVNLK